LLLSLKLCKEEGHEHVESEDKRKNSIIAPTETERTNVGIEITIPFCVGEYVTVDSAILSLLPSSLCFLLDAG
jgi:hypothetical protein